MTAKSSDRATLLVMLGLLFGVSAACLFYGYAHPASGLATARAGRIGLAAVFLFTALGHFVKAREMSEMLPARVPLRVPIILASGVFELGLAVALAFAGDPKPVGWIVIAFLAAVFPVNVSAAARRVDFGGHGAGPRYLLVRAPLQILLMAWAYWFAAR